MFVKGQVSKVYAKRVKTMKYMRNLSYFGILGGVVLVLCCISTSAYALSDDEPIFRIYPPDWPQPYPVLYPSLLPLDPLDIIDGSDEIMEYLLPPGRDILPQQPRFNGVPPIEPIDIRAIFDSYNFSTNSYGIAPPLDVTYSSGGAGSVSVVPEPTTGLLLGMGALALKRRKRA